MLLIWPGLSGLAGFGLNWNVRSSNARPRRCSVHEEVDWGVRMRLGPFPMGGCCAHGCRPADWPFAAVDLPFFPSTPPILGLVLQSYAHGLKLCCALTRVAKRAAPRNSQIF